MDTLIKDNDTKKVSGNYHSINIDDALHQQFQPILLCNFKKQEDENLNIYNRNVPNSLCVTTPLLSHRPINTSKCVNMKLESMKKPNLINSTQSNLRFGNGDPNEYFSNIGVESNLKNLNCRNTKCSNPDNQSEDCYRPKLIYPNVQVNKCSKLQQVNPCQTYIIRGNNYETLYDYSSNDGCNLGCQQIWNNRTKRNS